MFNITPLDVLLFFICWFLFCLYIIIRIKDINKKVKDWTIEYDWLLEILLKSEIEKELNERSSKKAD